MDPGAELQGHPFLVDEEIALPLDAEEPVWPGVGVDTALGLRLQSEEAHHIVVPEPAVRPEDDLLGGIFNEVSAGHHRQIPDVAGILAHRQILPLF